MKNWDTLTEKVLKKLFPAFVLPKNVVRGIVDMKPGVAEVCEGFRCIDDAC